MRAKIYPLLQISTAAAEMPEGRTGNLRHYDLDQVNFRTFWGLDRSWRLRFITLNSVASSSRKPASAWVGFVI
jgi:hypothetical protein